MKITVIVEWPAVAGHKVTISSEMKIKEIKAHILQEISKLLKVFLYGLFNDSRIYNLPVPFNFLANSIVNMMLANLLQK